MAITIDHQINQLGNIGSVEEVATVSATAATGTINFDVMTRQALRDVPPQAGFPWDVQWPVEP